MADARRATTGRPREDLSGDFAEWVAARGPALHRFAHLVTGGATVTADAADLVQDALVGAYPRWQELARSGTAEAYVRRSIVNASVTRWRQQRRLVAVPDAEPHVAADAHHPDPTAALANAALAWRLCADLPPTQRAAVVLRFYDDWTFGEIARVLDCTESTARSHVHRALAVLRTRLAEEGDDD